jgi:nucleoside-diphosphate-sugar epimerase
MGMAKNAFVTGGTGFIGTTLINKLVNNGWQVTALYRESSTRAPLNNLSITWVKGSVTNRESLINAIPEDCDVVFHLAGDTNLWSKYNPRQTAVNVEGTENTVGASVRNNVRVFIHTSSVAAWGDISGTVSEETPQQGGGSWINYERTKWAGEREALKGQNDGMRVVILNPANVIGPHDKNNWGRLFFALRDNKLPFIADGSVSITHVGAVADAHLAAAECGQSGERYILGGEYHPFPQFVRCINNVSNANNMPVTIPAFLFRGIARVSTGFATLTNNEPAVTPELAKLMTRKDVSYSSQKAIKELDYTIPPMQKSVQDCYSWLNKEGLI